MDQSSVVPFHNPIKELVRLLKQQEEITGKLNYFFESMSENDWKIGFDIIYDIFSKIDDDSIKIRSKLVPVLKQREEEEAEQKDLIILDDNEKPVTTSKIISEVFGKKHKNVLQSIETLDCSEEFNGLNFQPVDYEDKKGELRKCYEVTRDGFFFLVMGFTGKKAAQFKETFIKAFNAMEQELMYRNELNDLMNEPEKPKNPEKLDSSVVELCKIADKSLKGKASLRILGHLTGAPVEDLANELDKTETKQHPDIPETITSFVENCCLTEPKRMVEKSKLYSHYKDYCYNKGYLFESNSFFFKNLYKMGEFTTKKLRSADSRPYIITGIGLK
ncbi:MAG: Rha family transcriptional regulator [Desulfobacterales bacterium]|nr:Rha family transcriptional regulator [Desulfobacterales bacterium]